MAVGHHVRNELSEAQLLYEGLLNQGNVTASIYSNLASIHASCGRYEQASPLLMKALALEPGHVDALANLGELQRQRGELAAAEPLLRRALAISPDHPQVRVHLARLLHTRQQPQAAMEMLEPLLQCHPRHPQALELMVLLARLCGRHDRAVAAAERLLELAPGQAEAHQLLGIALKAAGRLEEAACQYEQALALRPGYAEAEANLSMILLLQGQYARGLPLREARLRKAQPVQLTASPALPRWTPQQGRGGEVLVVGEQGLGDMIQFMRYVPLLEQQLEAAGGSLSLCLPEALQGLARCSGIARTIIGPQDLQGPAPPVASHWLPLLSLPLHLGVTPAQPLIDGPYLQIPEEPRQRWTQRLRPLAPALSSGGVARRLVGIHWQGNIELENLVGRSFPLGTFAPLAGLEEICLLSLQKGYGSEQLDGCGFRERFHPAQAEVSASWDFVETAAIVLACDLVITSDSAVAHLAGGLGVPTWLLLQHIPDWRWGLQGDTSFWYPSLRLFRQGPGEGWPAVIERVRSALLETVA